MSAKIAQSSVWVLAVGGLALGIVGCPVVAPPTEDPEEFTNANVVRGGLLYDAWWSAAGLSQPTGDHPLWASRPDTTSNTRTGTDTWRCKECHGWDYKGVNGAYGTGSHRTGVMGILGTAKSAQEVFDLIKGQHGFGNTGLTDSDIWDLTKFVKQGVLNTDDLIDASTKTFRGTAATGQTLYTASFSGNIACSACHGSNGQQINFANDPDKEFVGTIAASNPWEFQHKVRFGQPGSSMPSLLSAGGTSQNVADLGAYCQSLPTE